MKKQDLTLPEWAFMDAHTHLGNLLEGRTVLQHIRSYTMLEIFALDDLKLQLNPKVKSREFLYKNSVGIEEKHVIVVHFSLTEYGDLNEVLEKAIKFYCDYMTWEDNNIEQCDIAINN